MLRDIDQFFFGKEEPLKGCLIALREIILKQDHHITTAWKYRMPFFCYKGKMFCYLWVHKTLLKPYIGFVEGKFLDHPDLLTEKRARMKIFLLDPNKNLPVTTLKKILKQSLDLYRKGTINTKS